MSCDSRLLKEGREYCPLTGLGSVSLRINKYKLLKEVFKHKQEFCFQKFPLQFELYNCCHNNTRGEEGEEFLQSWIESRNCLRDRTGQIVRGSQRLTRSDPDLQSQLFPVLTPLICSVSHLKLLGVSKHSPEFSPDICLHYLYICLLPETSIKERMFSLA